MSRPHVHREKGSVTHAVVIKATITDRDALPTGLSDLVPIVSDAPGFVAGYWIVLGQNQGISIYESILRLRGEPTAAPHFLPSASALAPLARAGTGEQRLGSGETEVVCAASAWECSS